MDGEEVRKRREIVPQSHGNQLQATIRSIIIHITIPLRRFCVVMELISEQQENIRNGALLIQISCYSDFL